MNSEMDNSKTVAEWLNSLKSKKTKWQYQNRWAIWLDYCRTKGILSNGDTQLEDMKQRRQSNDNTEKYFYDNEVPKFFQWLKTEYKGKTTNEPLSESSALSVSTAIRSFFSYHRYSLEIKKEALPSSEKVTSKYEDHAFDIYQLRAMFNQGDLKERTILTCGKELWLRVGDFIALKHDLIELMIKREEELAQNESRETDIIEFELTTEKEKEPCSCHLSRETVELLKEYMRTYPKTSEKLFDVNEDALNYMLRRLAEKAKITVTGRIRWHCLRKFGITLMHGKVQESVMKLMTGKHVSKDLKTYIQNNRETFKAFKLIEPQISLTKTNGNGNVQMAKQLEEMKKEAFKRIAFEKLLEKIIPKETLQQGITELAKEYGMDVTVQPTTKLKPIETKRAYTEIELLELDPFITKLAEQIEKKDLERILKENGNNE